MSEAKPDQEPSMEEILASIRRIISEDDAEETDGEQEAAAEPEAEAAAEPDEEPAAEAEAEPEAPTEEAAEAEPEEPAEDVAGGDDVLELTEEIQDDGTVVNLETGEPVDIDQFAEDDTDDDVVELEMKDAIDEEPVAEEPAEEPQPVAEPPPVAAPPPQPAAMAAQEGLVAPPVDSAATSSFSALANAVAAERGIGSRTLEDLVKEVMRPMIKEWLDEHLAELVERLVSREIERMARNAEDDY